MSRATLAICSMLLVVSAALWAQFNSVPVSGARVSRENLSKFAQHSRPLSQPETYQTDSHRVDQSPSSGLTFAPVVAYESGGYEGYSVAVADVNGDGIPDAVVANANDSIGILLGNGDGTFKSAVTYGDAIPLSVQVADMNGDGKPDLVFANFQAGNNLEGGVGVLLGNGDGTFQLPVIYDGGGMDGYSVVVGDVNGDGIPDVVIANLYASGDASSEGIVGVLLGNGDGTLRAVVAYGSGGYRTKSVAISDVNHDGKLDLLVANTCATSCSTGSGLGSVSALLGNGDGTFQPAVSYASGGYSAVSIVLADVNGDLKQDALVANEGGSVGVLLGNGDGTFQGAVGYGSGGSSDSIAWGDVDGDGKPDLIVANGDTIGTIGVLLGNGDGTFQSAKVYRSGGSMALSVAVADLKGDGKLDVLASNYSATTDLQTPASLGVLINISPIVTTTELVSSLNPSNLGQSVTFTSTVTPLGKGIPTGTVNFLDGSASLGTSSLNGSGVATLSTSTLSIGTHPITAAYSGDTNFAPSTSSVLNQIVQGAIALISPTSLNFFNQTVGIASRPQVTTLTNTGNVALSITSIQISGTNGSDFVQTNNCPSSLTNGASCSINVTFKPQSTGHRTASVTIADNAMNSPQTVSLAGVGVLPAVTFSPTSLTFPIQVVFTTSPAQRVTLTNTGLGILKISGATFTGQFGEINNCGSMLAPGASCSAEVNFKPKTKGVLNGTISLTDNAPGSPQKVSLSGIGTYLQITPAKINFENQPVHTTSLAKTITISNKGTAQVTFNGISITGANGGDFSESNNCPTQLISGSSCFVKVKFTPSKQGTRTANVSISDDGGGSPQTVPLSGTGTP